MPQVPDDVTVVLGTLGSAMLAGVVTAGSGVQRLLGVLIAASLLAAPFMMKALPPPSYQVTLTLVVVAALRVIDLAVERPSRSVLRRMLHVLMPFDTRVATRCRPHLDIRQG